MSRAALRDVKFPTSEPNLPRPASVYLPSSLGHREYTEVRLSQMNHLPFKDTWRPQNSCQEKQRKIGEMRTASSPSIRSNGAEPPILCIFGRERGTSFVPQTS